MFCFFKPSGFWAVFVAAFSQMCQQAIANLILQSANEDGQTSFSKEMVHFILCVGVWLRVYVCACKYIVFVGE